ncbi:DUF1684 domain-containing protein [Mucilaginibacter sp. SP1R1]|uniref:DUF1684 domain-containing protein n=1 Tax=Mucilaginibacter sp. SP1R1 TaxID=2723091 RepID=UPI001609A8CF|nr:DUF1684 domain-containing protein [Mucilaginibacter sp. SP1R1]MBB6152446.1 hypothetical protein [Mucilaginibacter sp. SP1R1]
MRKIYFLLFISLLSYNCFGQDYKTQLAEHRKSYIDDFLKDDHSPLKKDDLPFLRFYDADSTYRVTATVEVLMNQAAFVMPVFSGTAREYERYATIKFILKGKPVQLALYKSVALSKNPLYADYLFLPFTDDTNGTITYGGGRYIDLRTGDIKNGSIVIDFNKAYNPYCAYSSGYSCPKPPDENRIGMAVEAGEKLFEGEKKH